MVSELLIEYANPADLDDTLVVSFTLTPYQITQRWVTKVLEAKQLYQIDHPNRFYGFAELDTQIAYALKLINGSIDVINSHQLLIDRKLDSVYDQDTLNYLHHVFEVHHGLLDQQNSDFWNNAPTDVRAAIADLNINVHRCESIIQNSNLKRHVVTWYGLPKVDILNDADYALFTSKWEAGTVFLNYVEIGKTLEDLTLDNDQYIAPGAFQPFKHFSADFVVKFTPSDSKQVDLHLHNVQQYYNSKKDFFGQWQQCFASGSIPVAVIKDNLDLEKIKTRQFVKSVNFK